MLDAIGIVARDLRKSIAFYELLGLKFAPHGEGEPDHFEAMLPSGIRLMIDSETLIKDLVPGWQRGTGSPGMSLCFKQNSPGKVDELFRSVEKAGFKAVKAPWDAFWGQRYASVSDPDGNQVDLFASLE